MSDLVGRLATARDYVSPNWTAARELRVRQGIEGLRRARARARGALLVVMTFALAGVFALFLVQRSATLAPPVADAPVKPVESTSLFELPDGSSVARGSSDARVQPVEVTESGVTLRLESGSAKFSVTPNPARPFRVLARDVAITVLGTVFDVTLERDGVRVGVESGRVRVDSGSTSRELSPGERALFTVETPTPPTTAAASPPRTASPQLPVAVATTPSWRSIAAEGDYARALERLNREGPSAVRDTPDDLLLAADVARLGGQPARAVAPLERVVANHPGDSRAPLAAFTLGRTLLDQLARPREAAKAFATSRRLAPSGALAQDALAREVESWARANEPELARARAREYVELYPQGRRAASVRRLGGLED